MTLNITRRDVLLSSGALTALAPGLRVALAAESPSSPRDMLVVIFLRFGSDGLTLVPPSDDADYRDNRPTLGIGSSGPNPALPLGALDGVPFFMNPNMPELKALYDSQNLAVIHAAGVPTASRSHFVSQDKMERGIADGEKQIAGGWLGRHLLARNLVLPGLGAISTSPEVDVSLQGYVASVAIPDVTRFDVAGGDINLNLIEKMYVGSEPLVASGQATIATIKTVKANLLSQPKTLGNPAGYTTGQLSTSLRSVANIIKANIGLEIATVDLGGWDHHTNLNAFFGGNAQELSKSIAAFWTDMTEFRNRLSIVVMTEFGRRVQENANGGLDHGAASVMMALGGSVNGGRMYGKWPGLRPGDLVSGDLKVTTDYRQVLQEILVKRRGETTPQAVFPTLAYQPLGILR